MAFKQKSHKLQELYGIHAHIREGGTRTGGGGGETLICILHRFSPYIRLRTTEKMLKLAWSVFSV